MHISRDYLFLYRVKEYSFFVFCTKNDQFYGAYLDLAPQQDSFSGVS